jgi:hypothetical protein
MDAGDHQPADFSCTRLDRRRRRRISGGHFERHGISPSEWLQNCPSPPCSFILSTAIDIAEQLSEWVHYYNWDRPHDALKELTPIDRVCHLIDETPLWDAVSEAYDPMKEQIAGSRLHY